MTADESTGPSPRRLAIALELDEPRRTRFAAALAGLGIDQVTAGDPACRAVVTDRIDPSLPSRRARGAQTWLVDQALGEPANRLSRATGLSPEGVDVLLVDDGNRRGLWDRDPVWAPLTRSMTAGPGAELTADLDDLVQRELPTSSPFRRADPVRILVAGHDLGFLSAILRRWRATPGVSVAIDHVPVFARHDTMASSRALETADVVLVEWCSPVAAWYSRNVTAAQRLSIRLHRVELSNSWTDEVDVSNVDTVVTVSPHYAQLTRERTSWPAELIHPVANAVDLERFNRLKLPHAQFNLGFIGMVPTRKRLDLALKVFAELRRRDRRYQLFVKTAMPWDYPWNWRERSEREGTAALLSMLAADPDQASGVIFDPHGSDVAAWFTRVGHVLSTSDDESFHLTLAEGMASGAVPAIRNWLGSDTIYDSRWIHGSALAMAESIDALVTGGGFAAAATQARRHAAHFDLPTVADTLLEVVVDGSRPDYAGGHRRNEH